MVRRLNVYEAVENRLKVVFDNFDYVYVSFSGGKDSSVLLNLCIDYIRRHNLKRRLGVFHIDYEIQYKQTIDFVEQILKQNRDIIDVYHCCVPFKVSTCTSMYSKYWRPWDPSKRDLWVRPLPEGALTADDFDFFSDDLWDYNFQYLFSTWLKHRLGCSRVCSLVGIRTQESYKRWLAIHSRKTFRLFGNYKWAHILSQGIYNAYPIFDWTINDVWTANGKMGWAYNSLYDLYYQAGVPLTRQRVASPFISEAIPMLHIYRAIDPDTWGKMISRVNGVNFAGMYGTSTAMGWRSIKCPKGFSWERYMEFLLSTLPTHIRHNYEEKLRVSKKFWRERGGCLAPETIDKLRKYNVQFELGGVSNYHTDKVPVRMKYIDDIDIKEFKEIPSYKRMCVCILKNDHSCKYMGFAPVTKERELKKAIQEKYKNLKNGKV